MPDQLTALDGTFLELEQADDSAHMHIGGVLLFEAHPWETAPPVEDVRRNTEARLPLLPRYRQRLSEPRATGISWPCWVDDDRLDLGHHVRRAALPAPAGEEELREWAGEFFSQRLDRARPLWELVEVELADGRWALVSKTHHCLVDGVGSVDIAYALLDTEREGSELPFEESGGPAAGAAAGAGRRLPWLLRIAGWPVGRALQVSRRLGSKVAGIAGETASAAAHPRQTLAHSRALVEVLARDELVAAPRTSLNDPIGAHRSLAVLEVPLARLKGIRGSLGGTVNDVVLAAAAGGFRKLLLARGEDPPKDGLRAMVPVNIRAAGEHLQAGNKITSLFVHLPVAEPDPRRRYERQRQDAESLKSGSQAQGSRTMIELAGHLPPILHTFLARSLFATRLFNVTITNVPGPQQPLYCLGSKLQAVWPLVPIAAEHAVGLAVFSYDGTLFFCLNADRDTVPDLDLLREGIEESIEELEQLAGVGVEAG